MTHQPGTPGYLADLIADLREITEAVDAGNTWAQIGAALEPALSGREAKRHAHKLREQIAEELRGLSGRLSEAGARNGGYQVTAGQTGEPSPGNDSPGRS